jgi:hypothetical protein
VDVLVLDVVALLKTESVIFNSLVDNWSLHSPLRWNRRPRSGLASASKSAKQRDLGWAADDAHLAGVIESIRADIRFPSLDVPSNARIRSGIPARDEITNGRFGPAP